MTSDSILVFGPDEQCTQRMCVDERLLGKVETPTSSSANIESFRRYVEMLACVKVNPLRWMGSRGTKQLQVTPFNIHSKRQDRATSYARRWCWFFLYNHPAIEPLSTPKLGKMYGRDATTVLYGIRKVQYSIADYPDWQEAKCLHQINDSLAEHFGPFDIEQAARG